MNQRQHATSTLVSKTSWLEKIPHPFVLIFGIIVVAAILTHIIPAGQFDRVTLANGREGVVPGSFHYVEGNLASFMDVFLSIPEGLIAAANIIFITFIAGATFQVLEYSRTLENAYDGLAILDFLPGIFVSDQWYYHDQLFAREQTAWTIGTVFQF